MLCIIFSLYFLRNFRKIDERNEYKAKIEENTGVFIKVHEDFESIFNAAFISAGICVKSLII
jgi:hypothetical protein